MELQLVVNVVAWNIPMYDTFQYMCNVLCDVSVLFLPTLSDVFVLQTDASGRGVVLCLVFAEMAMNCLWVTSHEN